MTKKCKKCDEEKDVSLFSPRATSSDGLQYWCKKCRRQLYERSAVGITRTKQRRKFYAANSVAMRRSSWESVLRTKYGITPEEYDQLLIVSNGCCAICCVQFSSSTSCVVDHDHATGKVRDLLCSPCNIGLGYFEKMRDSAPTYLSRFYRL